MNTTTENGAPSLSSTIDSRLDLFFKTVRDLGNYNAAIPLGQSRSKSQKSSDDDKPSSDDDSCSSNDDKCSSSSNVDWSLNEKLYNMIEESWEVDKLDTLKILMNWRDCRGGKGDYTGFLVAIAYLQLIHQEWIEVNLHLIPEYGCWLDLIKLWHISHYFQKEFIMNFIVKQLNKDNDCLKNNNLKDITLLAKWLPSENSKWDRYTNDRFCLALCRKLFNVSVGSPVTASHLKNMRKMVASLRKDLSLVETNMCNKQFDLINYENVPSVAMQKYKKAFNKNDGPRFTEYLEKVSRGEKKINSSQVYPHDLVRQYFDSNVPDPVIEAQWKEIKSKVQEIGAFDNSIAIVDVSGSMAGTPLEVAIALGLLSVGNHNNNQVITFSETPQLHTIPDDSLFEQVKNIKDMKWGMNTNFEAVMELIIDMVSKGHKIERLYIFSDMQFDVGVKNSNLTHFNNIKDKFSKLNLMIPEIVFWNLRGNTKDFPVSCDNNGVIMLVGYSPSLLTSLINKDEITPLSIMFDIIHNPRYDKIIAPN